VLWPGGSPEFGDRDEPLGEVSFDYGFVEVLLFSSANRAPGYSSMLVTANFSVVEPHRMRRT
jgi:hypothetical protein